jgi:uncharacterized membrane protein/dienelactone hydrolase
MRELNELNSFLFATNICVAALCGALLPIMPLLTRKSFLFGAKVPPEAQATGEARALKRNYAAITAAGGAAALAFSVWQYMAAPGCTIFTAIYLPLALMAVQLAVFVPSHGKALRLKSRLGWNVAETAFADTKSSFARGNLSAMPQFWYVISLLVALASFAVALARYPSLPDSLPTHWGFDGEPNGWSGKSLGAVLFMPICNAVLAAFMWLAGALVEKAKLQIDHDEPAKSFAQHRKYRRLMGHGMGAMAVAMAVLLLLIGLQTVYVGFDVPIWLILALSLAPAAPLCAVAVRAGQGGALLKVDAAEASAAANGDIAGSNAMSDDRLWAWGLFYHNPDDPAFFVGNRFGSNIGFNYSRLPVKIGAAALALLLVASYAWMTLLFVSMKPPAAEPVAEPAAAEPVVAEPATEPPVAEPAAEPAAGDALASAGASALEAAEAAARQAVEDLAAGNFDGVAAHFDETMAQALSAGQLKEAWDAAAAQAGEFAEIASVESFEQDGYCVCLVTARHSAGSTVTRAAYDGEMKIAGLFLSLAEGGSAAEAGTEAGSRAELAAGETGVTVGAEYPLDGALALPDAPGKVPAAVLVHGSGPHDMDESFNGIKVFKDISDYLAANGIAALRYDKRTYSHAARLSADITVREETIEDAILAGRLLAQNERIDSSKIFVVGHSLGGMLAPRIVSESGGVFAGAVIMAGSPRSLLDIVADQNMYMISLADPSERDALTRQVEAAKPYYGLPQGYIDEMDAHPASEYLLQTDRPFLILQGGKDFQVSPGKDYEPYRQLAGDRGNFEFRLYDNLNHMFTVSTMEKPTTDDYVAGARVDSAPLSDIAAWIKAR